MPCFFTCHGTNQSEWRLVCRSRDHYVWRHIKTKTVVSIHLPAFRQHARIVLSKLTGEKNIQSWILILPNQVEKIILMVSSVWVKRLFVNSCIFAFLFPHKWRNFNTSCCCVCLPYTIYSQKVKRCEGQSGLRITSWNFFTFKEFVFLLKSAK